MHYSQWEIIIENTPTVLRLTDEDVASEVLKKGTDSNLEDDDVEEAENAETISIERCIQLTKELISGMEQKIFFKEHDILSVYKIQEKLLLEQRNHLKQKKITDMFAVMNKK